VGRQQGGRGPAHVRPQVLDHRRRLVAEEVESRIEVVPHEPAHEFVAEGRADADAVEEEHGCHETAMGADVAVERPCVQEVLRETRHRRLTPTIHVGNEQ
jgi:hypothetical protein